MRILFMGTSEFAIPALEQLVTHNHDIIGVVTQPDRPSGRGKRLSPSPVKKIASAHSLKVYQPEKVREPTFVKTLNGLMPDLIVVAAFGQLLPQLVLDIPPCGVINLHPSLLPKYRGAAPIQWALINGEKETGISLMLLDAGEDTGDIICRQRIPINSDDTAETLHDTLAHVGAKLLIETLSELPKDKPPKAEPQILIEGHAIATHAPRLTKDIGHINWNEKTTTIFNLIRGTAGWPGAYTYFRNTIRLKITAALPHDRDNISSNKLMSKHPGTIVIDADREMFVITGDGNLQIIQVQPATKRVMKANDFVNGYQIKTGDCFLSK